MSRDEVMYLQDIANRYRQRHSLGRRAEQDSALAGNDLRLPEPTIRIAQWYDSVDHHLWISGRVDCACAGRASSLT